MAVTKTQNELFKETIERLKNSGIDTACYKDVVIALESENRHYQDLIAYMKDAEYQRLDENRADHIDRGKFLGQCAMTAKILEYFMEITGAADDHRIHMGIEDLAAVCTAAWMDLQGMEPVDG